MTDGQTISDVQERRFGQSVRIDAEHGLAVVKFDRGSNRNAIDQETLLALIHAARWLADQVHIQVVILSGSANVFSAGIDLKDPARWHQEEAGLLERRDVAFRGSRLCRAWEELPQCTIAAIEGMAVGASLALAVACDWRVVARDAYLHLPELAIGVSMGWGAIPRLNTLIGPARTKRALLLGERLTVDVAERWGLVDAIAEPGNALIRAHDLAHKVLAVSGVLVRMTKEAVNANATAHHRLGVYMDGDQSLVSRDTPEIRETLKRFAERQ